MAGLPPACATSRRRSAGRSLQSLSLHEVGVQHFHGQAVQHQAVGRAENGLGDNGVTLPTPSPSAPAGGRDLVLQRASDHFLRWKMILPVLGRLPTLLPLLPQAWAGTVARQSEGAASTASYASHLPHDVTYRGRRPL